MVCGDTGHQEFRTGFLCGLTAGKRAVLGEIARGETVGAPNPKPQTPNPKPQTPNPGRNLLKSFTKLSRKFMKDPERAFSYNYLFVR
jgi:hypothetical protein